MSDFFRLTSAAALARGWHYYKEGRILSHADLGSGKYAGRCAGSHGTVYDIVLDVNRPRQSTCTCPFAAGRHRVCKHMAALYLTLFPDEVQRLEGLWQEAAAREEAQEEADRRALLRKVRTMKKAELQDALLDLLFDGPDWQYERFLRDVVDPPRRDDW